MLTTPAPREIRGRSDAGSEGDQRRRLRGRSEVGATPAPSGDQVARWCVVFKPLEQDDSSGQFSINSKKSS